MRLRVVWYKFIDLSIEHIASMFISAPLLAAYFLGLFFDPEDGGFGLDTEAILAKASLWFSSVFLW
jgi:hypothetical protein